jgi:hypothetical protein
MSESQLVAACIQLLCLWGCDVIRQNTGAIKTDKGHYVRFGKKGLGDITALSPHGRWVEVEAKVKNNPLSDDQVRRKLIVEKNKGLYIVCRDDVSELERLKGQILAKTW